MSDYQSRVRPGALLLFRRLRVPMLVLIAVYAVAIFGFTLVPGVDDEGNPWRMSFFHAFYFVSFLGTTIGLGEIPYAFSDYQRMWALVAIYSTVVAWLYGIGALLSVIQDPLFKKLVSEASFAREVARIREPFVVLCGYGDAGTLIARELAENNIGVVVIDSDSARIDAIETDGLPVDVPALHGHAGLPKSLLTAGVQSPYCMATLALTGDDATNLAITQNAKLLNPNGTTVCVAHNHEHQAAMARVGAAHIVNPYDAFAERLRMTVLTPSMHVIYEALTTQAVTPKELQLDVPTGRWLVVGYGRFGKTVRRHLLESGNQVHVICNDRVDELGDDQTVGEALDAEVMRRAGVENAVGLVCATSTDSHVLGVTGLAREINPGIYTVVRQNSRLNTPLFRELEPNIATLSGYMVAGEVLRVIRAPQLSYFLRLSRHETEEWAANLLAEMRERIGGHVAESWSLTIDQISAPALVKRMRKGQVFDLGLLMTAPDNKELRLRAVALLLQSGDHKQLWPGDDTTIKEGDCILFCGRDIAQRRMNLTLRDGSVLDYLRGVQRVV